MEHKRHNPHNDSSCKKKKKKKVSSIKCSEATHGWAVMYGLLFIFFLFVYPSNPSCYIGKWQQMSRDISHRAPVELTRRRGGGAVSHIKGFERRWERLASPSLEAGPTLAAVVEQDKRGRKPPQMVQVDEVNTNTHAS